MPRKRHSLAADGVGNPLRLAAVQPIAVKKPRRRRPRPEITIEIEAIYEPDIERMMAGLCILLGLPYTKPTRKVA